MGHETENDESCRQDRERLLEKLRAIADSCAKLMGPGPSAIEHGDFLYNEHGLPKRSFAVRRGFLLRFGRAMRSERG